jgi:hypothetical protein
MAGRFDVSRISPMNVIVAGAFLILTAALAVVFLNCFPPEPYVRPVAPFEGYDKQTIIDALAPQSVSSDLKRIESFGSRFVGQPGFQKTADYIRAAYASAGLQTVELKIKSAIPVTIERKCLGDDGQPLPDVEIYPFLPNHFQPMVSPTEGIRGRLIRLSEEILKTRHAFDDCIGVVDCSAPPPNFECNWARYAQLGFRAIIIAHPDGMEKINWSNISKQMVSSAPVNFVRLAASKAIFNYLDQIVTLRVRVEFKNVENSAFVGRLKAEHPSQEAIVFFTSYDACSILPDLAPGGLQAMSLATHLNLLKGLANYRASMKRDAIFIAYGSEFMAAQGLDAVLRAIGAPASNESVGSILRVEQGDNESKLQCAQRALDCIQSEPGVLKDQSATERALQALDRSSSDFLSSQCTHVMDTIVFELLEQKLQARIPTLKVDNPEAMQKYLNEKRVYDQANMLSGYSILELVKSQSEFCEKFHVRERMLERMSELKSYHLWRKEQSGAALAINSMFQLYGNVIFVGSILAPTAAKLPREGLSFILSDEDAYDTVAEASGGILADVVRGTCKDPAIDFTFFGRPTRSILNPKIALTPNGARLCNRLGYASFSFINTDRVSSYESFGSPILIPGDTASVGKSLEALGLTALSLVHGNGNFKTPPKPLEFPTYGGTVYAAGVGQSIVPQYGLENALVCGKGSADSFQKPGYYKYLCVFTDPYGGYSMPQSTTDVCTWYNAQYDPTVAWFGENGIIAYTKDEGALGQSIYHSTNLGWGGDYSRTNIVCFRSSPVSMLDLVNPQTLAPYSSADFISCDGLSSLDRIATFIANDSLTAFIEPDQQFYVLLRAGSADNPLVQKTRAFMLGDATKTTLNASEIDGAGYLSGDHPFMRDMASEVSASMLRVNEKRLALQKEHKMSDPQIEQFHRSAEEYLKLGNDPHAEKAQSIRDARDSATYATLIYPEIRDNIYEAIMGIVWYLGLLVLFVFFFEKLAFGFTDIRKQLATQAFIFLSVFLLLKLLHPAFAMIRSSLMILLGFVIILTSGSITVVFSGKVEENFENLKKKRGQTTAADVNTLGVIATAFMLGLNNMHRRLVRTGLTCATLVLITFAIICFTSVQTNVVDRSTAIAKAPYQGLLIKREDYDSISASELFALQTKYGDKYKVCPRETYIGTYDVNVKERKSPQINLVFNRPGLDSQSLKLSTVLLFTHNEPLRGSIRLLTKSGWLPKEIPAGAPTPILIPDTVAAELGLTTDQIDGGEEFALVNGKQFRIHGIFDSAKLQDLQDVDGRSVLPFDIGPMQTVRLTSDERRQVLASDDDAKVSARNVIIAPLCDLGIAVDNSGNALGAGKMTASVAIAMPDLNYKSAKLEIDKYLEQNGQKTYYGLDGTSFVGKRGREHSLSGFIEILIPLILASLTVLNTMKGSVYERRDEIFVYNAVGIAPRFIFFIFFAEAFVYAVVGSELGYILSQAVGRILTELNLTGGLNMTFTSRTTIYASMAIMAVTMISSYFPARSAMEVARPADDSGWKLPEPAGDSMCFTLPFTFGMRDRIAVLAFFRRYFSDHGEGSSGLFFSGIPQLSVFPEEGATTRYIPGLRTRIWLKPFDLGVSQDLCITLPHDSETNEFIATIELQRVSGTREAWVRLNQNFVTLLRKHFLHWRAVNMSERAEMFEEAREALATLVMQESPVLCAVSPLPVLSQPS